MLQYTQARGIEKIIWDLLLSRPLSLCVQFTMAAIDIISMDLPFLFGRATYLFATLFDYGSFARRQGFCNVQTIANRCSSLAYFTFSLRLMFSRCESTVCVLSSKRLAIFLVVKP